MVIENGQYHPGSHISHELLHFLDENLTMKQIQQFLEIVNYLKDFIPKVSMYIRTVPHAKKSGSTMGTNSDCSYPVVKTRGLEGPKTKPTYGELLLNLFLSNMTRWS